MGFSSRDEKIVQQRMRVEEQIYDETQLEWGLESITGRAEGGSAQMAPFCGLEVDGKLWGVPLPRRRGRGKEMTKPYWLELQERGEDPEAVEPARELLMAHAISRGQLAPTQP